MLPFFCHRCHLIFTSNQASTCPRCNSDFIEIQHFPTSTDSNDIFIQLRSLLDNNIGMDRRNYALGPEYDDIIARLFEEKEHFRPASQNFVRSLVIIKNEVDCSICLKRGEMVDVIVFFCGHKFHARCALGWLKMQNTCPNCRKVLDSE